jgi:hypothetical protein
LIVETSILNLFTVVGKAFQKADIQSFIEVKPMDFVDKGIVSICKGIPASLSFSGVSNSP